MSGLSRNELPKMSPPLTIELHINFFFLSISFIDIAQSGQNQLMTCRPTHKQIVHFVLFYERVYGMDRNNPLTKLYLHSDWLDFQSVDCVVNTPALLMICGNFSLQV